LKISIFFSAVQLVTASGPFLDKVEKKCDVKKWTSESLNILHASRYIKHVEIYQGIVQASQWLKSSIVLNTDSDSMSSMAVPTICNQVLG
jgi:hypothetical protein